jgi:DNA-binding MarR family transcriptional regulator
MSDQPRSANPFVEMIDEILRMSGRIRSVFGDVSAGTGLSAMETTVLTAVAESRYPPTVPQIGRSLGHPRQVIQRAVNALVEAGLLDTSDNPEHKRARLLTPTAAGLRVKREADARANKIAELLLKEMDGDLCREITRDLRQARAIIERHLKAANA